MDWNFAIEKHKEALKRILALLVAMAAVSEDSKTLPRHLHRAILRLLRPAEAAARRLIVIAARGLLLPPSRRKLVAKPSSRPDARAGTGIVDTGISMRQLGLANVAPPKREPRASGLALPLTDTLPGLPRRRYIVAAGVPRISGFGFAAPVSFTLRRQPSADDPVDATSLRRRLASLAHVLDDLPAQARRFARWRARLDRAMARKALHRMSPLRPGRPPGWRKPGSRRAHEMHRVLDDLHGLAFWALEQKPDTS